MKYFYFSFLFWGLLICFSTKINAQNYEVASVPYKSVVDPTALTDANSNTTIQYIDGLGRLIQTVQKVITPLGADLVSGVMYDIFGRDSTQFLPAVVAKNNGDFVPFYGDLSKNYYSDGRCYNLTEYESSPLNRITGQSKPGGDLHGKKKSIFYLTNGGSEVKNFYVDGTALKCNGTYAASTLNEIQTMDEDGKTVIEYTDKLGRKILTRSAGNVDTYYVYDDLNNLRYVLPPLASDLLSTNTTGFSESPGSTLDLLGYIYHYDGRKRCIEKKLPGADWVYMVYDLSNRIILSQDGNQRSKNKWIVNKYDCFGRLLYNGLLTSSNSRSAMESTYSGRVITESYVGIGGVINGYSSGSLTPTILLKINYYDNYSFLGLSNYSTTSNMLNNVIQNGYTPPDLSHTKSLLTGSCVYHLGDLTKYETTAIYYDKYGRVVQTRSNNHLGGYDITYNALDFTGKSSATMKTHGINGTAMQVTEIYSYTYDKAQRLLTTTYKLNNSTISLANNFYDELGRDSINYRHNNTDTLTYAYNIRNWTTMLKSGKFVENLFYNTNPINSNECYNGNISYSTWTYNGAINSYNYVYDDLNRLSAATFYNTIGLPNNTKMYLSAPTGYESFNYDKQGNIIYLSRNGIANSSPIDLLTYKYLGNQVVSISDQMPSQNLASVKEYQNAVNLATEFNYDKNGNMVKDKDRNIVAIRYNILNLPDTIQFLNGNQIMNRYAADGRKLETEYFTQKMPLVIPLSIEKDTVCNWTFASGLVNQTGMFYIDNKEYQVTSGNLQSLYLLRVHNTEGYADNVTINPYGPFYYYYRKDHLGNNREVWRAALNINGTIIPATTLQRTQYYPSGLPWASNSNDNPIAQPYKYNGKQFEEMNGYDAYDYGARTYFSDRNEWGGFDPLAEKYYSISPYAYCGGNPVNRTDPDGRWIKGTDGRRITYSDQSGWSKNATSDIIEIGNAMMITPVGKEQVINLMNKEYEANVKYDTGTNPENPNNLGTTNITENSNCDITRVDITLYESGIKNDNEIYKLANQPGIKVTNLNDNDKLLIKQMPTLTERIGQTGVHEFEHAINPNAQTRNVGKPKAEEAALKKEAEAIKQTTEYNRPLPTPIVGIKIK